jgi:hypothetical protein
MDDIKLYRLTNLRTHRRFQRDEESLQESVPPESCWEDETDGGGSMSYSQTDTASTEKPRSRSPELLPLIKSRKRKEKGDVRQNSGKYWKPIRKYDWSNQRVEGGGGDTGGSIGTSAGTSAGTGGGGGGGMVNSVDDSSIGMGGGSGLSGACPAARHPRHGHGHGLPHPLRLETHIHINGAEILGRQFAKNLDSNKHDLMLRHLNMVQRAEHLIHNMPLVYMVQKPELYAYAVEKACLMLIKPGFVKIHQDKIHAFNLWKAFNPEIQSKGHLNEKQFCFMVIAKVFSQALKRHVNERFQTWARLTCTRYNPERLRRYHNAARKLQLWLQRMTQRVRQPYKTLLEAVQKCVHRRRAIKFTVEFERARRRAYRKMRKGVASRRRVHFAARIIQRIFRWMRLFRYIRWRNARSAGARKLQRWRRKWVRRRSKKDKLLIHLGMKSGGYTMVWEKMPEKFRCYGILIGMEECISQLQRWYFTVCGRLDMYMKLAARRAKMELEMKMNSNATIIQSSYRAYLWRLLQYAAIVNNRARRIQRGFRAHQYRVWAWRAVERADTNRRKKLATMIRRAYDMMMLYETFEPRRALLDERERLEIYSTGRIQYKYRSFIIYRAYIKEKLRKFYAGQRMKTEAVMKAVRTIQRLYRLCYRPDLAPLHLKLCGIRSVRNDMYLFWRSAFAIQKPTMTYIKRQREKLLLKQVAAVNKLWFFTKSFLLRLVIHYRIIATRIKRNTAASVIKKNYHLILWLRVMAARSAIAMQRILYDRLLHTAAFTIQCMVRKVMCEYFLPLRVAGR